MSSRGPTGPPIPISWIPGPCTAKPAHRTRICIPPSPGWASNTTSKKGQYSSAYSGFEGIEDNTDRIPTREEVEADTLVGKTLANALKAADVTHVDIIGLAESHCVKETALDARKLGFEARVFKDLTAPVSEELGIAARRDMAQAGVVLA